MDGLLASVSRVLFAVTDALLVPDIVLLLALLGWSVMVLGEFTAEALARARNGAGRGAEGRGSERRWAQTPPPRLIAAFLEEAVPFTGPSAAVERLLGDCEVRAAKWLEGTQIGVRVGPMLGLMGTLIPMGPALQGLASGDVAQIAANIRIAFATTVAGLVIGGLCYTITTVRRRWYAQDLNEIEFLIRKLTEERHGQVEG